MGRIKEIERKASGRRKRNPVVYLICEGSETEIRYFKKFRSRECNIDIVPIPSQYKSADKLVQKARATIGYSPYYKENTGKSRNIFHIFRICLYKGKLYDKGRLQIFMYCNAFCLVFKFTYDNSEYSH